MSLIAAVYSTLLSLRKRTWVSGMTVRKYEVVISPADNEEYKRITVTGGGTTDPADDTTNYVAVSYERTAALTDVAPITRSGMTFSNIGLGATQTTLPAIGVSARTSILSVTGRGCIDYFAFMKSAGGTSRIEIVCDGRTILDNSSTYTTGTALLAIGQPDNGDVSYPMTLAKFDPKGVEFRRSLQVYLTNTVTSSTTSAGIAYHLRSQA